MRIEQTISREINAIHLPAQQGSRVVGLYARAIATPTGKIALIRRDETFTERWSVGTCWPLGVFAASQRLRSTATFEALTAASAAFWGRCGHVGLHQQEARNATAPVLARPGPLKEGGSFVGTCYLGRLRNNGWTPLTHPTRSTLQMFRGKILTEVCL